MPDNVLWKPFEGPQTDFLKSAAKRVLFGGSLGPGKSLCNYMPVLTPFGEMEIGNSQINDQVLNPDGTTARIIGVYPQNIQNTYRITFDDRVSVDCTADHLWLARFTSHAMKAQRTYLHNSDFVNWRIMTTEMLIKALENNKRIRIPLTLPVNYQVCSKFKTTIDPYMLGLLLGDGTLGSPPVRFTTADESLAVMVEQYGFVKTLGSKIDYHVSQENKLVDDLKRLGLIGKRSWEKSVPHRFKYGNSDVRLAVLQGLMDSDGYCDKNGWIGFTSVSQQLSSDVQHLVRSLGGKATLTQKYPTYTYNGEKKDGRKAYVLYIQITT